MTLLPHTTACQVSNALLVCQWLLTFCGLESLPNPSGQCILDLRLPKLPAHSISATFIPELAGICSHQGGRNDSSLLRSSPVPAPNNLDAQRGAARIGLP